MTSITEFSDGAQQTLAKVDRILQGVSIRKPVRNTIARTPHATLKFAKGLLESVDKDQVKTIVGDVQVLTSNLSETSKHLDGVVGRVDGAVKSITEFSDGARGTLAKVDEILEGRRPGYAGRGDREYRGLPRRTPTTWSRTSPR